MIQIERRTGLGCNSQRLHQKEISVEHATTGEDNEDPLSPRGK